MEGKAAIADMLSHQLKAIGPSNWLVADDAPVQEEGGVTTAWLTFETNLARGHGIVRLIDGKIWTLLTTMVELKGHEEPSGTLRKLGARHGAEKMRSVGRKSVMKRKVDLASKTNHIVSSLAGDRGAHRAGR